MDFLLLVLATALGIWLVRITDFLLGVILVLIKEYR